MPVTQEIRFELNDQSITSKQAHAIAIFSSRFPTHDLRVSADGGVLKIYVGKHYEEEYRFWITEKGIRPDVLVEKDLTKGEEDPNWQQVDRTVAEVALSRIPKVAGSDAVFDRLETIEFKNRQDAAKVIDSLENILVRYGFVSVADYYDMVGFMAKFTDTKFGWTTMSGVAIKEVEGLYSITLPSVEPFKD